MSMTVHYHSFSSYSFCFFFAIFLLEILTWLNALWIKTFSRYFLIWKNIWNPLKYLLAPWWIEFTWEFSYFYHRLQFYIKKRKNTSRSFLWKRNSSPWLYVIYSIQNYVYITCFFYKTIYTQELKKRKENSLWHLLTLRTSYCRFQPWKSRINMTSNIQSTCTNTN